MCLPLHMHKSAGSHLQIQALSLCVCVVTVRPLPTHTQKGQRSPATVFLYLFKTCIVPQDPYFSDTFVYCIVRNTCLLLHN